ncbi:hypothetical protein B7R22_00080 [Subtercola boreus]|uniref:DNA-binding response regulator n=1 Tax=Subtercola boreus TaxID=120213 RepID=A0A3E0W5B4_9MICO|nr:hypothetical protein B7R22_00080 [Subtercola boreus]
MLRVLIAEDETDLADSVAEGLRAERHVVEVAYDGASALSLAEAFSFDVILLDRDLPLLSGDSVCRALTALRHPARIIMVTAASLPGASVEGLDLGADEYITKPFGFDDLLARLRAVERRQASAALDLTWRDLSLDSAARRVTRSGRPIELAPKEFDCLRVLLASAGRVVPFSEFADRVWPVDSEPSRGAVKAVIHSLRRKLGQPDPLETQHGLGYRLGQP